MWGDPFDSEPPAPLDDPQGLGLFSLIDRVRAFTADARERAEIERVQAYIERGFSDMRLSLQRHAEFDAWCAERGIE